MASDGLQLLESLGDVAARVLRGRHRRRGGRRGGESLLGAGEDAVVEPGRRRGGAVLRLERRRVRYLCMIWHDVLAQGETKEWDPVLVNFVPAVAYHFCLKLNLTEKFSQPRVNFFSPALSMYRQYQINSRNLCRTLN